MQGREILSYSPLCPHSGQRLGLEKIPPHRMTTEVCANGALFHYCQIDKTRVFTRHWGLVKKIVENSDVIGRKIPRRRTTNGS